MILVDTNVWSEALKPRPDPAVSAWAVAHQEQLWLSAVVLAELRAGAALLPRGKRRSALEGSFDLLLTNYAERTLAFDPTTARHYAEVLESAKRRGRPIATADAMIAATALQHRMTVATRDSSDFAGADVPLTNPWEV